MPATGSISETNPWVSFCMSTYKRPEFLKEQLASLMSQTFTNFEIIISDNDIEGSAEKIVKEFNDPRIRYQCNEENLGMIKSFNRSLKLAKGDYIVFITDDDPLYPEMLQVLHDLSVTYPGYGVYMGSHNTFYSKLSLAKLSNSKLGINSSLANCEIGTIKKYDDADFSLGFFKDDFGSGILMTVCAVKRDIALAIDGLPDFGSPSLADTSFILLAGSQAGLVFVNKALGIQMLHGDNYSYADAIFKTLAIAPQSFYEWTMERLPQKIDIPSVDRELKKFTGRLMTGYFIFIKKNLDQNNIQNKSFEQYKNQMFSISFMRKWKMKYMIAVYFPQLFNTIIILKNFVTGKLKITG